jgi:single-strand DNA-binding protein
MGNVGGDAELRYTSQGVAVTRFSIATSEYDGKDAQGKNKYRAEWHNIIVWGKPAETAGKLKKGDIAHVLGKKTTVEYTKGKSDEKAWRTEIVAEQVIPIHRDRQEHPTGNYDQYGVPSF